MDTLLLLAAISLITCLVVTVIIVASWRFKPGMWAADLGLPRQDAVAGAVVAVVTVAVILGGSVAASVAVIEEFGVLGALVAAWSVMIIFGLWDFLIIDWLLFIGLKPSWFYIEGMEDSPHIYQWQHHAKESIPALFIGIPIAAIATGIAALVT
ncbi:MAG: hypothetical protein AAF547_11760 [Actinomycetota bacterium]